MFLGKLLALAGISEGKYVTWFPSYGAEVRGGTAHCAVIISDSEIASPLVTHADIIVAMNQPSVDKFLPRLEKGGMIFLNKTMVKSKINKKDFKHFAGNFTEIALGLGEVRIANMVALGALIEATGMLSLKSIFTALEKMVPSSRKYIMQTNKKAIEEGRKLVR